MDTHKGSCYCRAVQIEATGAPLDMGYCHCANCRKYSGAPVNAVTLWKIDNVKIIKGSDFLGKFKSSDISDRRYCTKCGAHVMIDHPKLHLIDVRGAIPGTIKFKPTLHINYDETILPIKDGLPKFRDSLPKLAGPGK
jgi:hypothetical protein